MSGRSPGERFFHLRNRLIGSERFRRVCAKLPFFKNIGNRSAAELFTMMTGYVHSQVVFACVKSGLLTLLEERLMTADDIARDLGLPVSRVEALLRAAAALDVVERRPSGQYGTGRLGAALRNNPGVTAMVHHHQALYRDLLDPLALVGDPEAATHLRAYWGYARSDDPAQLEAGDVADYSALMAASQRMIADQVLGAVSLRGVGRLLDVGGGSGAFAMAAARRWPQLRVTVADLPAVASLARERIAAANLSDRIDVVGLDATRDALPTGPDMVSFVRILHDHDDPTVARLLTGARRALSPGGTLLVAEPLASRRPEGRLIDAYFSLYLLAMGQGKPRDFAAITALVEAAGFADVQHRKTATPLFASAVTATYKHG